ncbi:ATP-binding protein [Salinibacterium sp. ZJ77]|uniref:ATP-binding protein n=1 Tax=Salinibacterium sp. ZJ77 TaxID=2708337 RepID=UPI0032650D98
MSVRTDRDIDPAPLAALLTRGVQPFVLLIDGRSGAGKTVLGRELAARTGATLVSLDEVYPGWDGLAAGGAAVEGIIRDGSWRRWDWVAGGPAATAHIDRTGSLIVEGCGALTRASRALADHSWWIDRDADERRERALRRDGDTYAPHWERWARQEDAHIAREDPEALADLIIRDGKVLTGSTE